jgi:hypothetical protein
MTRVFPLFLLFAACATPAEQAQSYGVTEQQLAQCRFEASRRDGVAWPDEVQLCLKGHGYHM